MKNLLITIAVLLLSVLAFVACNKDDEESNYWTKYKDWRELNANWLKEQQNRTNPDGTPYYKTVVPPWNPSAYVLIHYFNDRNETEGNLSPMYTSTVDVRYVGARCNGKVFDESTNNTSPAPGIFRTKLNAVIPGWTIALSDMRVLDTAEVIIPYELAYGAYGSFQLSDTILPYSNLQFNIRLVDIYRYEAP